MRPLFVSISPLKQLKIFFSPIAFYFLFVLFAPVSSIQVKFLLADRLQPKIFKNNCYLIKNFIKTSIDIVFLYGKFISLKRHNAKT